MAFGSRLLVEISIQALEQKLAQYPKGTGFTLDVSPLDPQIAPVIVSELMKFADAKASRSGGEQSYRAEAVSNS